MAEDREDASPGDKNSEEFEVLDEVGEVEGWDDDFLPDDFEEMETDDEQDLKVEEKAVDGQDTNADKKTLDRLDVKVEKNAVSEQDMKVDKKAVDQQDLKVVKDTVDQQDMKVNKKAVDQQDVKVSKKAVNDQDVKLDKKTVDQKGVKVEDMVVVNVCQNEIKLETKTENDSTVCKKPSNIGESNIASKENKEQSNKSLKEEASVGKHEKLVNELSVGSDTKLSDGSTGKDVKSSESTGGKIAKLVENSTAKDVKSESSATKDLKLSQSSTASDVKSCESTTAKDVKLAESSTARDAKLSERSTGKDVKPSENSTGKDAKSYESSTGKAKPSESSTGRDAKPSESSTGRNAKPSESSTGRDAKPSESLTGRDAKPSASSASKDVKSSASSTSKDVKPSAGSTGKDAKPSVSSTGKDAKPSAGSTGKDTKMYESLPAKDAKTSESLAAKDAKTSESSTGKDAKPPASSTGKDAKLPASSTGKDAKLSSQSSASKDKKSSDHSTTVKDAKLSNQSSSGKEAKHAEKDVSSTNKTSVDKKKAETRHSEPQKQTASCAPKRKSDDSGPQKPDEKKVKLSSEKTDHKTLKTLDEDVEYVSSSDPQKEHMIKKKHFVKTTINLSEEVKRNRDFRRWTEKYRKDGMVFPVFELQQPTELILFSRCQLISGYEDDSTKLCLGVKRNEDVLSFWACEQKFVPTIRKVVKAFEELVQSSGKPLFDPTSQQGYWQSIGVLANSKGQAVLQVHLHATDEREGEARFTEVKDILLATFDSKKAGLDVDISSIYLRLALGKKSRATERTTNSCIMGPGFISESIKGVTVKLYPWTYFSTGTSAMAALCEEMVKIMLRERCETVVEIGCGTGIIGQVLSKHCKMVLGVDTPAHVSDAKVNAQENKLTNCMYFDGKIKAALAAVSKEMRCNMSALVVVNALCYDMAEDPVVLDWLRCTDTIQKVVYINTVKNADSLRVTNLCIAKKEVRHHRDDPMPFLPLYVLPVDLGTRAYTIITVLKHVENNFINELYHMRDNYTVSCVRIAISEDSKPYMVSDGSKEETRSSSKTSNPTSKNVPASKSSNQNAKLKEGPSKIQPFKRHHSPIIRSKVPGNKSDNQDRNRADLKNEDRERARCGSSGPTKTSLDIGRNKIARKHEVGHTIPQSVGNHDKPRKTDLSSSVSRNVWLNEDGLLTTRIDALRHSSAVPAQDLRTVLQSRSGLSHRDSLLDAGGHIPQRDVKDLRTVLQGKRLYAERQPEATDNVRSDKYIQDASHDGRKRKAVDSKFTHDIVPPGTEDLRYILQEKKVMVVENVADYRNVQDRDFYDRSTTGDGRSHFKGRENDLRSYIEENRATYKNVEIWEGARTGVNFRDIYPHGDNRHTSCVWNERHSRVNEPEAFPLVKDSELFKHDASSKINVKDERKKVMFSDGKSSRDINLNFRGTGAGRSFDDADVGRTARPKADDIASGVKTDVRGINIRSSGHWKAKDVRGMENIHESFSKFDAHMSNMNSAGLKDHYQHDTKSRSEFDRSFLNASVKSDRRALSPTHKLHVMGHIRREIPYHGNDKTTFYGGADKSNRSEWFPYVDRNRLTGDADRNRLFGNVDRNRLIGDAGRYRPFGDGDRSRLFGDANRSRLFSDADKNRLIGDTDKNKLVGDADRNRLMGDSERNRTVFEADRSRMVFDEAGRNRTVGESVAERIIYGAPERIGTITGGLDDRNKSVYDETEGRNMSVYGGNDRKKLEFDGNEKRLTYGEIEDRNRPMYGGREDKNKSAHNGQEDKNRSLYGGPDDRNRSAYGGSEDRNRPAYGGSEDKNRSAYGGSEDRNRSAYGGPEDRNRSAYGGLEDRNRSTYGGPEDRNRSAYGGPEDRNRSAYGGSDDRVRSAYGGTEDRIRSAYGGTEDRIRSAYGGTEDRIRSAYGGTEDRNRPGYGGTEDRNRSAYGGPEDRNRSAYGGPEDRNRSTYGAPDDRNKSPYGGSDDRVRSAYGGTEDRIRSAYGGTEDRIRSVYGGTEDRNRPGYGGIDDRNRPGYGVAEDRNRPGYGGTEDRNRPSYGGTEDRNRPGYDGIEDRNRPSYGGTDDRNRPGYGGTEDRNRPGYGGQEDRNRPGYGGTEDRNRPGYGGTEDRNRPGYGGTEDRNRPGYGGQEDRNRSAYCGQEDRNRSVFSTSGDRNRTVISGSDNRSLAVSGVTERNRPLIDQADRNRNLYSGSTDVSGTSYTVDSKGRVSGYNRAYEEDKQQSFVGKESVRSDIFTFKSTVDENISHRVDVPINQSPQHDKVRQLPPSLEDGSKEKSKDFHDLQHHPFEASTQLDQNTRIRNRGHKRMRKCEVQKQKVEAQKQKGDVPKEKVEIPKEKGFNIPVLQPRYSRLQGRDNKKSARKTDPKYSSPASVQKLDAKNMYVRDRSPGKVPISYWASDRGRVPDVVQTQSSTNSEWKRVGQSGNVPSSAPWVDPWNLDGRRRDTPGRQGNAAKTHERGVVGASQSVDTKERQAPPPPMISRQSGKFGSLEERQGYRGGSLSKQDPLPARGYSGSLGASSMAGYGQTPEELGRVWQQLLTASSVLTSAVLPPVGSDSALPYGSLLGDLSGRSTSSVSRVFPWMN